MSKYYRHWSKGAWPFSTRDHGWPISDCTSEGLKASLSCQRFDFIHPLADQRYFDAVNIILSYQNKDGGWATYENTRTGPWVEYLNPSEVFGNIMIDYSYVECSSACIQSMLTFKKRFPDFKTDVIKASVRRGIEFILSIQRDDGSWYGSWAVCFTYGTWFGLEALTSEAIKLIDDPKITERARVAVSKACSFILSKQREDGGWGESYLSSQDKVYSQSKDSQVVNTGWAMLGLLAAREAKAEPAISDSVLGKLKRGVRFLNKSMEKNGDFPQQHISGVFNHNCMITYANYRNIFPIWALGRFRSVCGEMEI
mmetsp:Transcript_1807/g.3842  ORF Transcript_1807/g.3842 Transcript_1807/m.3842 type:complete len:312 (-) Transcript_1807:69-1004(-)